MRRAREWRAGVLGAAALILLTAQAARGQDAAAEIREALAQWTADFNAGRAEKVCDLFSRELRAQFRGQPERGYDVQCAILRRSLADRAKTFRYALDLKEIILAGEFAVVRLTWTLTVTPAGGAAEAAREPGIDIFRREADGRWRIFRYLAYDEAP